MNRDLSLLTIPQSDIRRHTVARTEPFFKKYEYAVTVRLPMAYLLRSLDHEFIDMIIAVRNGRPLSPNLRSRHITEHEQKGLHAMCEFLRGNPADRKMVICQHWLYFYTNDEKFIEQLPELDCYATSTTMTVTKVRLVGQPGCIALCNPQHEFRSYMRAGKLTLETKQTLKRLLDSQDDVKVSPGFKYWLDSPSWIRLEGAFFVDHNTMGLPTMLNLIHSGVVRKTSAIVPR